MPARREPSPATVIISEDLDTSTRVFGFFRCGSNRRCIRGHCAEATEPTCECQAMTFCRRSSTPTAASTNSRRSNAPAGTASTAPAADPDPRLPNSYARSHADSRRTGAGNAPDNNRPRRGFSDHRVSGPRPHPNTRRSRTDSRPHPNTRRSRTGATHANTRPDSSASRADTGSGPSASTGSPHSGRTTSSTSPRISRVAHRDGRTNNHDQNHCAARNLHGETL